MAVAARPVFGSVSTPVFFAAAGAFAAVGAVAGRDFASGLTAFATTALTIAVFSVACPALVAAVFRGAALEPAFTIVVDSAFFEGIVSFSAGFFIASAVGLKPKFHIDVVAKTAPNDRRGSYCAVLPPSVTGLCRRCSCYYFLPPLRFTPITVGTMTIVASFLPIVPAG
ncbi:hypothetical protein RGU70_17140 [Herbaspirillum sp. RTI4]|uniref:hypothetical protein n=1 Tax=Herbaspirillum sp. RTI4 TaxID=3048640 RepID=UPI002AB3650B|nr:hypothetical protein [Herbaspirillum sp. RTI4]MDY7580038.1 hypothetical protein [Herbaspirillum sp. RTI4]MEA9982979.1 hypothetical protein [Herbaspirillum sp. RTI4]